MLIPQKPFLNVIKFFAGGRKSIFLIKTSRNLVENVIIKCTFIIQRIQPIPFKTTNIYKSIS